MKAEANFFAKVVTWLLTTIGSLIEGSDRYQKLFTKYKILFLA